MSRALRIGLAAAGLAALPAAGAEPRLELALETPAEGERVASPAPWVEFRGRASGSRPLSLATGGRDAESLLESARRAHLANADVVLALDLSNTALRSSGFDVDGDGTLGRDRRHTLLGRHFDRPVRSWTSDWDDTIARAEIATARDLVPRLEALGDRVGLVLFASGARVRARPGPGREVLEGLDRIRLRMDPDGTDLARALDRARRSLLDAPRDAGDAPPRRAVVLFSDARPSSDFGRSAEERAIRRAAEHLERDGVRLHALAFGPAEGFDPWLLPELARRTRGRFVRVTGPASAPEGLGLVVPWRPRQVRVWNPAAERDARALRLFPNGRFDGFLPLVPGPNLLSVEVRGPGIARGLERRLHYRPVETEGDARPAILERLRRRTLETGAAAVPGRRPGLGPDRRLEIEVDQAEPALAPPPEEPP